MTIREARCAREAEISYATLALVTDYLLEGGGRTGTVETVITHMTKNVLTPKRSFVRPYRSFQRDQLAKQKGKRNYD